METFSALLAFCAGNSPVPGEFHAQRPVTQSFDVFFDLRPNKRLSKQWRGWWFETQSRSLWRHRNEISSVNEAFTPPNHHHGCWQPYVGGASVMALTYFPRDIPDHSTTLQWCHNGHDGVPNHRRLDCLLTRLFGRRSKKTSKLRVTGLCEGNSPVTSQFPSQRASNAEYFSIWWRHHEKW